MPLIFYQKMLKKHAVQPDFQHIQISFQKSCHNSIHSEGPEAGRRIIKKVSSILEPGGIILFHEFILEAYYYKPKKSC
ncbi:hypothetical protein PITCH_A800013 [uncultured Desulfobacterium sp.]|uniref:Uncharacterized protein n=1 Tax=uncultured Desulfobacterium sp. TaxID=201089 RepID=A0A445N313_9BACT|nr:hypothetical protein PITCH_A800013 [uncultured Desulfobacterium sp.]